jgi:hypothetical protein
MAIIRAWCLGRDKLEVVRAITAFTALADRGRTLKCPSKDPDIGGSCNRGLLWRDLQPVMNFESKKEHLCHIVLDEYVISEIT